MGTSRLNRIGKQGLVAAFLCLMCACCVDQADAAEPTYQGESASYWVNLLTNLHSVPFATKWRQLGSNAIPVLLRAVAKNDGPGAQTIRSNAAFVLSHTADPKVLTSVVNTTTDSLVKIPILNALVFNGDKVVTEAMVNALRDGSPEVRKAVIMGLGLYVREKIPEEMPALVTCLQDPDPDARCWAGKLLCHYSDAPFDDPVQGQGRANAMAFAAISNATNNPDLRIRKAAAMALRTGEVEYRRFNPNLVALSQDDKRQITTRINRRVLDAYSRELAISLAELNGTEWRATLHVLDENGKPVEKAAATISYAIPPEPGEESDSTWKAIKGLTDANGVFAASHSDSSGVLSFAIEKDHYYKSGGSYQFAFPGQFDSKRMVSNRSPDVTIVLKQRIHPVPMYVNRVDIAHRKKPAFDTPVGFDLTVGDFVAPYGKGTNAQMLFTWHADYDTNDLSAKFGKMRSHGWQDIMTITFPNSGDGIQEFDLPGLFDNSFKNNDVHSELRSVQLAPTNGYNAQLVKVSRWMYHNQSSSTDYDHLRKNYLLRVNTVLDKEGNVQSAQYGKIYGDFEEALTTYLNADPNSRELEYDMQHNLGQGGNNFYITY